MSSIQRAYTTELDLNNEQITACKRPAAAARRAYNGGSHPKQEAHQTSGTKPSAMDLHRELNALKETDVPWRHVVSTCAPQEVRRNLDTARVHYFGQGPLRQAGKHRGILDYQRFTTKK